MKVNKLMIVHATRQRAWQAIEHAKSFTGNMTSGVPFNYFFSIDTDDPEKDLYLEHVPKEFPAITDIVVADNPGCCAATNVAAARLTDEDVIFVNGDDLGSEPGWDEKLLKFIETIPTDVFLVHLPSGIPNSEGCAILQCISAGFYRARGHIFYPEYISQFGDNDLFHSARVRNAVYTYDGPPIKFVHEHPSFGYGVKDTTYWRTNSREAWLKGNETIQRRSATNFGVAE